MNSSATTGIGQEPKPFITHLAEYAQNEIKTIFKGLQTFSDLGNYFVSSDSSVREYVDFTAFTKSMKTANGALAIPFLIKDAGEGIGKLQEGKNWEAFVKGAKVGAGSCAINNFLTSSGVCELFDTYVMSNVKYGLNLFYNGDGIATGGKKLYEAFNREEEALSDNARTARTYKDISTAGEFGRHTLSFALNCLNLAPLVVGFAVNSLVITTLGLAIFVSATAKFFFNNYAKDLENRPDIGLTGSVVTTTTSSA